MIRVAIVDDEVEIGRYIETLVKKYFEEANDSYEVKYYQYPRELLWELQEKNYYDIFLLDIEMSVNGLEVARQIREMYLEPYVVFVTSYVKYSVKGYECNAYRYIVKEEIDEKLPQALENMSRELKGREYRQYIIETASKVEKIDHKDIFYIYIDGKYSYFCTRRGTSRVRKPLGVVYQELDAPEFVYADKGYIVNLQHVMALRDKTLEMRNGEEITVSKPQVKKLKGKISKYWRSII